MSLDQGSSAASNHEFVHLHVHSEYSLLDGMGKINHLVGRAKELGMPALALTDHGAMYGAIEFYLAAKSAGVKPIIGVEAYMARRSMTNREAEDKSSAHLLMLARNYTGYQNLIKLVSAAQLDGFYYKPRIDKELLAKHAEGLILTSGCPSGEVARAILNDDTESAKRAIEFYRDLVGPDNYYLEIQDHGLADQQKINRGVLELSKRMGIPVIASNDVHYVRQEHAYAQEILLCVQTNTTIDDPNRMRMETQNFYLRSPQEMAAVFSEVPEALRNTLRVAEQCNLEMDFNRVILPELDIIPEGMAPDEFLARLARKGMEERFSEITDEVRSRMDYELSVIEKTGFAKYILLVYDYVSWARKKGIFAQPRGSAAGCLVLYCLYVSDVDPIEYDLTFERFLNPDRVQMPDVDMDFQDDRRDEVIDYVTRKFGSDRVAQIVTFGRLAARAAIRDVGRAMAMPLSEVDRVAKLVPSIPVGLTLDQAVAGVPELQSMYDSEEHIHRLIDAAKSIEGVARHASTHAAGVVVSSDPLTEIVPIQRATKGEQLAMTQYPMKMLEKVGLLKMDFLGLNNLTILANTLKLVAETRAKEIDLATLPLDDAATFETLSDGETTGIFQLEGAGMRRWVRELKPTSVRHLMAIVALYRPGPMAYIPTYIARKEGRERIEYIHPKLEPILRETYGVIVYQDQVIKSVVAVAGFSMGQADVLRNAMSKKIREVMAKQKDLFIEGARENGIVEAGANRIWEQIEPFAGYAFNKAHAACYALLAYQTAYLKTHYPVEYMTALSTSYVADTDKIALTLGECRRLGVAVLPPDINRSQLQFSVEPLPAAGSPLKPVNGSRGQLAMRFGLIGVKGLGEGAIHSIVAEREKNGAFRSVADFCRRVDMRVINKRVVECLIKSGTMDQFGERAGLMHGLDSTMDAAQQEQRAHDAGQFTMFDAMFQMPSNPAAPSAPPTAVVPALSQKERLAWEKETLGVYISSHPFQQAAPYLRGRVTVNCGQVGAEMDGKKAVLAGSVSSIKALTTKKGDRMLAVQLEDLHGGLEVIVFPKTYERTRSIWEPGAVVVVEGKVESKDERKKLLCEKAETFVVPEGEPPAVEEPEYDGYQPDDDFLLAPAGMDGEEEELEEFALAMDGEIGVRNHEDTKDTKGHEDKQDGQDEKDVDAGGATQSSALSTQSSIQHSNGNGRKKNGERKALHLRIKLKRRGNDEDDIETLREAYRLLCSWNGEDSYELWIDSGGEQTRLRSPRATTSFNPGLEAALKELLGPDCVTVCEPEAAPV